MTLPEPPFWQAVGFHERLEVWISEEQPPMDVLAVVVGWIKQQLNIPYAGVRRYTDISGNLWWGRIPGTVRDGTAVVCSYWIDEDMRTVRCDSIATLNLPI